jgi:hypothetical protein
MLLNLSTSKVWHYTSSAYSTVISPSLKCTSYYVLFFCFEICKLHLTAQILHILPAMRAQYNVVWPAPWYIKTPSPVHCSSVAVKPRKTWVQRVQLHHSADVCNAETGLKQWVLWASSHCSLVMSQQSQFPVQFSRRRNKEEEVTAEHDQ